MLDPIPELSSFSMSITLFKLGDPELERTLSGYRARLKGVRSSDREAWLGLYREALELFAAVLAANERLKAPAAVPGARVDGKQVAQNLSLAYSVLQQASGPWQGRLQAQVRSDLLPKIEKSVLKLEVVPAPDPATGMTAYKVAPDALRGFYEWLAKIERKWTENNAELVAARANESLREALGDAELDFEVKAAPLQAPDPAAEGSPRLQGHSVPTPGMFDLLGNSYKLVMSSVTAVSGVGLVGSRAFGMDQTHGLIPVLLGGTFVAAIAIAIVTVPKKRRQGLARLLKEASHRVQEQLIQAMDRRMNQISAEQLNAIKKHLASEAARAQALARKLAPQPALPPTAPMAAPMPLSARDEGDLRSAWREAVERRIDELSAAGLTQ